MRRINNKKAAFEMTMGTIVIIVLAVSMLILGLVLTKKIMCSGIGLTDEINSKITGEIQTLFEATGEEVVCIGSTGEPVTLVPGRLNIIYCAIKAPSLASYRIDVTVPSSLSSWQVGDMGMPDSQIRPGDTIPKRILRLNIPKDADEQVVTIPVKIYTPTISGGYDQPLDFQVKRISGLTSTMC